MTRTSKTAKQRAEETRDRAKRRAAKAQARVTALQEALAAATVESDEAIDALTYAKANPALRTDVTAHTGAGPVTTTTGGGT